MPSSWWEVSLAVNTCSHRCRWGYVCVVKQRANDQHHPCQEQFGHQIKVIGRPFDADTATLRGAARYGLEAGKNLVSSIVAPRSYLLKASLLTISRPRLFSKIKYRLNSLRSKRIG